MNNKYKVLLLSITIMLVTSILLGTSYSLWSTTNTQSETNIVNVGCFTITFIDSGFSGAGDIDLKNQYPISDEEGSKLVPYKFSIKNECSIASSYVINLETSKESNFNLDYLKVKFNEETPAIYSTGLENGTIVLDSYSSSAKKLETGILEEGEEKIYTLRAWIEESATTTTPNVMGATWKGKVVVTNEATPLKNVKVTIVNNGKTINEEVVARTRYRYDLTGIDLGNTTNIYCTNGAEPTMDNNTLVIDKIHEDTVCTTSNSIVDTITNKLSTTKTGIVMLSNEDDVTKMTIAAGKEVALDLNGKEIKGIGVNETSTTWNSNHNVLEVAGSLIINDTIGTGGIFNGADARLIGAVGSGELIINSGNFSGRNDVVALENSYVEINGGNFESKAYVMVSIESCQNCNMVVNNGTFTQASGKGNGIIYANISNENSGKLIVNNGTFISDGTIVLTSASNKGIIEIKKGTFTSPSNSVKNTSGTINIDGGTFESTSTHTIYNDVAGTININNGIFKNSGGHTIYNLGRIIIKDGDYSTDKYTAVWTQGNNSYTEINGGNFRGKEWATINLTRCNNCNLVINGGTIQSATNNGRDLLIYAPSDTAKIEINGGNFIQNNSNSNIFLQTMTNVDNTGNAMINGTININGGNFTGPNVIIDHRNAGVVNICKMNLVNGKTIGAYSTGYIYYASNAFGNVTPTFAGTTANIQVKNDVCN